MRILLYFLVLLMPVTGYAQKTENGNEIEITRAVNEDLYITGSTITVNAPVYGDIVIGAGTIVINDTVSGDVIVGGGKITLNGYIGDDLRAVAGEAYLNGTVQGDVVLSAGTFTTSKRSLVYGNMLVGAGTVTLNGAVEGRVKCRGSEIRLNGEVRKEADCRGESLSINGVVEGKSMLAANQIHVGEQAAFHQDVSFWQKNPSQDFNRAMKHGTATYERTLQINDRKWQYLGFASILFMIWYLSAAFITILIIQYLFGKTMSRAADEAFLHTMRSISYGFLFLIGIPVAAFVMTITVIGIPVGILLVLGYFAILVLANVITSVVVANWINRRGNFNWGTGMLSLIGLFAFILIKFISLIPVFGWFILLVICALAFGSILTDIYQRRKVRSAIA